MKNVIEFIILMPVLMLTRGAEEIYTQVGDTIRFHPPFVADLHNHYVYWYFGDKELISRNPLGGTHNNKDELWSSRLSLSEDYSLTIKNITKEQFGIFSCELKMKSVVKATVSIHLLKVTVTMNPPSLLLPEESLSLDCEAQPPQSDKKPQIHWLNPQGDKMKSNQGQLTLTAKPQHSGKWTCVVTNNGKENNAAIFVSVLDISPAPSTSLYTFKSSSLTIPCSIRADISWKQIKAKGIREVHWSFRPKRGKNPTPDDPQRLYSLSLEEPMTWKPDKDQGLTPVADPKTKNLSLTKKQWREEDRGDYECALEFENGVPGVNRTVHVEVLQITASPGTNLISGQQLNLTCGLGHPLPSGLQLKWFPPVQSSLPSLTPDHHPARLTIPEVGTGDGGKWRCELWQNSTFLSSGVIVLKIEPRLSVWMLVIIGSVAVIVILLLILVFILYRRRQKKTRHLRHRLCQCKTPKPKGFYRT